MLQGLEEVEIEMKKLNISFHLLRGKHVVEIPKFVKDYNIGCVVCDFSPLRIHRGWVDGIKQKLPVDVPFLQVDAYNIVPPWIASEKQENLAFAIRPKITSKFPEFLTDFPALIWHPFKVGKNLQPKPINWKDTLDFIDVDKSVGVVDWIKPGYRNSVAMLELFIKKKLKIYDLKRNDPTEDALSNLSPYFHFGQLSVQRAIIEVSKHQSKASKSVETFREQAIIRRELSENFCFYNANYDNLNGTSEWARKSLNDHRNDEREYIYSREEFDQARTHDDLWNSAQIQLVKEGKMHCYFRMYWAKKILEWTNSAEEALEIAIYLNDRYSLDGRDPNGYVGVMWSIGELKFHVKAIIN